MLRRFLIGLCRALLDVFFRRIEVVGRDHLPEDGALIFALNHPSGLIDPLFILCLSGRRVSFLAKAPLFRMPFIGLFVRAFECLPVERSRDGGDPAKNREMMQAAAQLLARGNALAVFPEGTSHSDPSLKPFRSGAARIALSARALSGQPVRIVPGALYYESKHTFRSRAVLALGEAVDVPLVELSASGDSPVEAGQQLTALISRSVNALMPTAETAAGLTLAEQAERVLYAALRDSPAECPKASALFTDASSSPSVQHVSEDGHRRRPTLAERMASRRRLIDGHEALIRHRPEEVNSLISKIESLNDELELAGLPIDARPLSGNLFRKKVLGRWLLGVLLTPLGLLSFVLHAPAYLVVRKLAFRMAGENTDILATVKVVSGLLFFPLSWLLAASGLAYYFSDARWLFIALLGPPLGAVGIAFQQLLSALNRSLALSRKAEKVAPKWAEIRKRRAEVAEQIATLLGQT